MFPCGNSDFGLQRAYYGMRILNFPDSECENVIVIFYSDPPPRGGGLAGAGRRGLAQARGLEN